MPSRGTGGAYPFTPIARREMRPDAFSNQVSALGSLENAAKHRFVVCLLRECVAGKVLSRVRGPMPITITAAPDNAAHLELDLADIGQLVAVDAAWPLHPGCLRPAAEAAIIDWARRQPSDAPLAVTIFLPEAALGQAEAARLEAALANHFGLLAEAQRHDTEEHMGDARKRLALGLAIFFACMTAAWWIATEWPERPSTRVLRESIGILGWVALWKPFEMLLHDRRPLARRLKLLRRIAAATVRVCPSRAA